MYLDIQKLLERIKPTDRVLDLGGWDRVFPRANVVADLNSYETRKIVNPEVPEQFTKDDWIIADFCSPAFWNNIPDKSFDFIVISHTLEDIRDPLYVCSQMIRCGKAGYIEAPSKFRECAKISASDPYAGYDHHRWFIEANETHDTLLFKAKLSWAHQEDYAGDARRHLVTSDYHYQFNGYFWEGSFKYLELFPKGTTREAQELRFFYANYPYDVIPEFLINLVPNSSGPKDGSCIWVTDYSLPSERMHPQFEKAMKLGYTYEKIDRHMSSPYF